MKSIIRNIKARFNCKKFNIWTEQIDPKRKADVMGCGDWIAKDGTLYYGNPWFIFFVSAQNVWWKQKP